MNIVRYKRLALTAAIALSGLAVAEDNSLAPVTVTASASGEAKDSVVAPASISVITREELEQGSYRDISEAIRSVPGLYVPEGSTGKGGTGEISIRGLDPQYTLILVDGVPQGSQQGYYNGFGSGAEFGWLPPVSAIERIEVIRGPMSSLYGSAALGGVVNIITKPTPEQWSGSVSLDRMSQQNDDAGDRHQAQFQMSGPLLEDRLAATIRGGFFNRDEDAIDGGYAEFQRRDLSAALDWTISERQSLGIEAGVATQDTFAHAELSGSDRELQTQRLYQSLNHELNWAGGLRTRSYVQNAELDNQTQNASYRRTTVNSSTLVPLGAHLLTLGGQYRLQQTDNPERAIGKAELERWDAAAFMEDEWLMTDRLSLTAGARWVQDENYGGELVPRGYAVFEATERLTFKGGVSAGYRTPDLKQGDSDWVEGGGGGSVDGADIGNSDLNAESSLSYELATYWSGRNGAIAGVTLFYTDYSDKIEKPLICDRVTGPDGSCVYQGYDYEKIFEYQNVDEAWIRGVELTLDTPLFAGLDLQAGYTFTDSEQESGDNAGNALNDQPRHRANLDLNWQATDNTRLWGNARYQGEAEQVQAKGGLSEAFEGYTLVDAGVHYRLRPTVALRGGVYNLLDADINAEDHGRVLDGRRLNLGIDIAF
ncbi:outer membrane receptor protein [Saccharospirillum sp. MSK14-1]|uniref:TonB-dependent receptor domain-containing protein n=1 Tax=Saccharospirillum sp. MSK14-1 TaxID=1897632 RepID=UPI000D3A76CB|nr:TonB-dependent receptor [Saccharospirillum sp. MSK14-1]PTY38475.1 outer membrane receptor protein [Saccharospirillum sp. MSK14-1]